MGLALVRSEPAFAIAKTYYEKAKREPTRRGDLAITSTDTYAPNFLDLVKALVKKKQTHVVVVTHGGKDGMHLPITATSSDDANNPVIRDLVTLVDEYPKFDATKISLFAKGYDVKEDDVKDLVKQCYTVRKDDDNCVAVHVRGCNIAADVDNLLQLRLLFDSLVVSAPEVPMLYATFSPEWKSPQNQDVLKWTGSHKPDTRRRIFVDVAAGRSAMVLDVNYAGTTSSTQGVIEHADDLTKWADVIYGNNTHGTQHSMPIAALWPDTDYFLPHESGYVDQLNASRKP
jgi:hypothetical protein